MKNVSINFAMKMSINIEILIIVVCGTHKLQEFAHEFRHVCRPVSYPLVTTTPEILNKF